MILKIFDQHILALVEAAEDTRKWNLIGNYTVKDTIVNEIETEEKQKNFQQKKRKHYGEPSLVVDKKTVKLIIVF